MSDEDMPVTQTRLDLTGQISRETEWRRCVADTSRSTTRSVHSRKSSTPSPSGSSHSCANYSASARMLQRPWSWRPGTAVTDFAPKLPSQCCAAHRRFRPRPAWCSVTGSIAAATVKPTQRLNHIVIVRRRHDKATKAYFAKRKAEGKSKKEIFRCLKRYVAREVYRTLVGPREEAIRSAA